MKAYKLFFYTIVHFLVDLSCIFCIFGNIRFRANTAEQWALFIVFYNFLAFALPMLLGLIQDFLNENEMVAALGCFLVGAGLLCWKMPFVSLTLIGTGNGMFHLGGGRKILLQSEQNYAPSGIFISSGTFGVYLGVYWGGLQIPVPVILVLCLFAAGGILLAASFKVRKTKKEISVEEREKANTIKLKMLPGIVFLFVVVVIRSYYGTALKYEWNQGFGVGLLFTACVAAGKFLGGILADKIGLARTIWISLGLSAILMYPSFSFPFCGYLSILFFNMTMPLTLKRMYDRMKGLPGFAFGFLMFGLFIGNVLVTVFGLGTAFGPWNAILLSLLSLLLLTIEAKAFHD